MNLIEHLLLLEPLDWTAAIFILLAWAVIGWRIEHPSLKKPSVSVIIAEYRRDWMRAFQKRDNRIFDAQMIGHLRQGTSFFASTSILAIGGVLALVGNIDPLRGVAEEFTDAKPTPEFVWQLKLLMVAFFLVFAFLRFVWAHRLFGYTAVVMGALGEIDEPDGMHKAMQAADLNIRASINFTRGLRCMYFALGALAWIAGPYALFVATSLVSVVLWRREFNSIPRQILLRRHEG